MKRIGYLFDEIIDMDNLRLADRKARKGKGHTKGVRQFDKDPERLLNELQQMLIRGEYRTSKYHVFKIYDPKERDIYRLPYYPDRIVHHAILNVLEPIYMRQFTRDTYSCIKGRGIHACAKAVKKMLKDIDGTKYCLKLDVRKYYPNIDHETLKVMHKRIIKDQRVLSMLDEIIDSTEGGKGIPIGNYLSQFFANFYLSVFDHWMKETLRVKYYVRYADDIVVFASNKEYLHRIFEAVSAKLSELKLEVKGNWQIFPIDKRGLDFVGYVFYHTHVKLRKGTKQNLARTLARLNRRGKRVTERYYRMTLAAWWGWLKYCDSRHLVKVLSRKSTYSVTF